MQRTFRDDLKAAAAVLTGGIIGWLIGSLIIGGAGVWVLLAVVMGVVLQIVVSNITRPLVRRAQANREE